MKIIKATPDNIIELALMLRDMYAEVFGSTALTDLDAYIEDLKRSFNDDTECVYTSESLGGLLVVKDVTDALTPTFKRYEAVRIYVKPEYRNSRMLRNFYTRLFNDYPTGDILGFTEINSNHIPVLDKRHKLVAKVYRLDRSK